MLRSASTRAILFGAMTTAAAFASPWLSTQPGLPNMDELVALLLVCAVVAVMLFQPAPIGPPRTASGDGAR